MANRPVTIDVDAIVASRFPEKKFPSWVLGLVKRFIHQDFLKTDLDEIRNGCFGGEDFAVVGNLPYYITSPFNTLLNSFSSSP